MGSEFLRGRSHCEIATRTRVHLAEGMGNTRGRPVWSRDSPAPALSIAKPLGMEDALPA